MNKELWVISHLRVGDVIDLGGEFVVEMVNDCRARCKPLAKRHVTIERDGKQVQFEGSYSSVNISPNSDVDILRRLGPNWKSRVKK